MCFDRNINGYWDVKFLECDYLLVQRSLKLTLVEKSDADQGLQMDSMFRLN